ncbi:hypothetical protein EV426DRAFT_577724 [Tirmania nivea]|nr:hypothetical protein EV426DRAFT_577724 [Tirmania nivea]
MPAILDSTLQCGITPIRPSTPGQVPQVPGPSLEEYTSDEVQDITTTPGAQYTRYINVDGLEETNFAITVAVSPAYVWETPYLGLRLWVDGVILTPHTYKLSKNHPTLRVLDHISCKQDDDVIYRSPLKFGKLEIVDDDDDAALNRHISEEELKHLGTIIIHLYRATGSPPKPETPVKPAKAAKSLDSKKTPASPFSPISVQPLTKVPEKKLKGQDISYGVQFGPARPVVLPPSRPTSSSRRLVLLDAKDKPFMKFRFLYRSKRALQSLGVLPMEEAPGGELKPILEMTPRIRVESPSSSSVTRNERDGKAPSQSLQTPPRAKKRKIEFVDLTELD